MNKFLLFLMWISCRFGSLVGRILSGVVFLFNKKIRIVGLMRLWDNIKSLVIRFWEDLVKFGFSDDSWKELKIIHKFWELWKRYKVFGLWVKVKYSFKRIRNSLQHLHTKSQLFLIIISNWWSGQTIAFLIGKRLFCIFHYDIVNLRLRYLGFFCSLV